MKAVHDAEIAGLGKRFRFGAKAKSSSTRSPAGYFLQARSGRWYWGRSRDFYSAGETAQAKTSESDAVIGLLEEMESQFVFLFLSSLETLLT